MEFFIITGCYVVEGLRMLRRNVCN